MFAIGFYPPSELALRRRAGHVQSIVVADRNPGTAGLLRRPMQPEDVYELCWAADPRIAPDGTTVAFVAWGVDREENDYSSSICLVPLDGSEAAQPFTASGKQDAAARWSPDGSRLAFVSNRDGKTKQLYVIPATGGEARRLTDLSEDVTEAVWSPDGTRLAFTSRVRDPEYDEEDDKRRRPRRFTRLQFRLDSEGWIGDRRRHVFTVPADGSAPPKQRTHGDYEDQSPQWSPDGRRLVFASARQDDWDVEMFRDLYVVDAEGGEPAALTKGDAWYEAPSWSPDGSSIACRFGKGDFDFPRHGQIALLDPETGEPRLLTTALDRNCAPYPEVREPVWDEDSLLFVLEDHGNRPLYRVSTDGSTPPEPVIDGDQSIVAFDCAGARIVHAV